jgi:carbon monoxide dehydrogenase subunit G
MQFEGTVRLACSRVEVWAALNDPDQLQAAIPGCEWLEAVGDGRFETVVIASIGPVRARLTGTLTLEDVVEPDSYTLKFALQGGASGFGQGRVRVRLLEEEGETSMHYAAESVVGGKLAQIGSRLIEGAVKKLSSAFFSQFAAGLAGRATPLP